MAELKEWFVMSKHERRGAIGLLLLLVALVVGLWLVKLSPQPITEAEQQQLRLFEAQIDSMSHDAEGRDRHDGIKPDKGKDLSRAASSDRASKGKGKGKSKQAAKARQSQSSPPPQHRLDEVDRY